MPATPEGATPIEPPAPAPPAKVKVSVRTTPKALVFWGKKSLGATPVILERPRDSGPMDLVLRQKGYLTVHTRAYTFRSDALSIKLTPLADADKLLGAKKAPQPEPATPGTVPSTSGTVPSVPGTVPSMPGTVPSTPGTVPSKPGTVPSLPGTVPSRPPGPVGKTTLE